MTDDRTGWTEEGDVDVPGARLHWRRRGRGPVVVLCHGGFSSSRVWNRLAADLEDEFEVVAYDARNCGLSSAPDELESERGGDLVAVVGALGLDRPAALGHSAGAASVGFAAAAHPRLFRAIVLEDPPWQDGPGGGPPVATERQAGLMEGVMQLARGTVDEIVEATRPMQPGATEDELREWAEDLKRFRPGPTWGSNILADDWRDVAAALQVPTLLMCGEPGLAIVGPDVIAEAKGLAKDLRAVSLAGAGHNVRGDAYAGYLEAVRAFLLETR